MSQILSDSYGHQRSSPPNGEGVSSSGPIFATLSEPSRQQRKLQSLFERHTYPMWRLFRRLGATETQAAQLVEEVLLRVSREIARLNGGPARDRLWEIAIATARRIPRESSHVSNTSSTRPVADELTPVQVPVESQLSTDALDSTLAALTFESAVAFVLFEIEHWSVVKIGRALRMGPVATLRHLQRARRCFARSLKFQAEAFGELASPA